MIKWGIITVLVSMLALQQVGCTDQLLEQERRALFSWSMTTALEESDKLFKQLGRLEITELYQGFSRSVPPDEWRRFLRQAQEEGVGVYYLAGTPEWGLAEKAADMFKYIDDIIALNEQVEKKIRLKGIVLDVEPYLTPNWEEDPQQVMTTFVAAMQAAYQKASSAGLEVVVCIPYFFDTKGYEDELESLIRDCSDTVAVMNYYKGKEVAHIAQEMAFAQQHHKQIIQIYELQKSGENGVTDKITYYNEGIAGAVENWEALKEAYPYEQFGVALHHYKVLEEVIGDE